MNKDRETSGTGIPHQNSQNPFDEFVHKQFFQTLNDIIPGALTTDEPIPENEDVNVTPKLKKANPSDIKRWASVVKAKKKPETSTESSSYDEKEGGCSEITPEILDLIFKTFPKSFESHRGFFTLNKNSFSCTVCVLELESLMTLSNHLKTRKHEDNIIKLLKDKLPSQLDHYMDFVSFYGYNLCCNLCRCNINMSSHNLFETIVNIIAHNSDVSHCSRKTDQETSNQASVILNALASANSEIEDNLHYIEKNMIPQFKCNLCNKNIVCDENLDMLTLKFLSHLRSLSHTKNQKAVETLAVFKEATTNGKDNFFVLHGNIICTYCNYQVEADLENMISHVNGVEHAKNLLAKLELPSSSSRPESFSSCKENKKNKENSASCGIHKRPEVEEEQPNSYEHKRVDSRLNYLLRTLPSGLGDVDCMVEGDKGLITCLICKKVVPPSTYNLKTHLLGKNHRKEATLDFFVKFMKREEAEKKDLSNDCIPSTTNDMKKQVFNCPRSYLHDSNLLRNAPCRKILEVHLCHQLPKKVPSAILDHLYRQLFNKNALVSQNEDVIVKSVDGKHSYCKVCKSLIPLSMDLNVLEENVSLHLKGKRHVDLSGQQKSTATTATIVRSLFPFEKDNGISSSCVDSNCEDHNRKLILGSGLHNTTVIENIHFDEDSGCHETNSSLESVNAGNPNPGPRKTMLDFLSLAQSNEDSQKNLASGLFVFGKEENKDQASIKNSKDSCKESSKDGTHKALPVTKLSHLTKTELETDVEVLSRRQKQIDYGKNTEGYARYCLFVPQRKRYHPVTPPKHLKCSRRTWDGLVRAWRRQLHAWDDPHSDVTSNLQTDIQPLPTKDNEIVSA